MLVYNFNNSTKYKNKIMQKSVFKFSFLIKSFFLITFLTLLGCSNPSGEAPNVDDAGSGDVPDLVVSVTANPTFISSDDTINLSAIVTNRGKGASDSTILRFYRSDDNIISNSDDEIDDKLVSALAPEKTDNGSARITGHISGIQYYGACVEAVSNESNKDNNCSAGFAVTIGSPDLGIKFMVSPTVVASGDTVNLSAIVTNSGTVTSGSTTLYYYRSDDDIISSSDTQIAASRINGLPVDSTSASTARVPVHNSTGIRYYGVCVGSVFGESNKDNNCSTGFAVTIGSSDLVVGLTASKTVIASGDTITLSTTITNIGKIDSRSITLSYYRSDDDTISPSDTLIATSIVNSLAPDSSTTSSLVDNSVSTGYHGVCVVAVNWEANTTNNCSAAVDIFKITNIADVTDDNNYELNGASSVSTAQIGSNTYLFVAGFTDNGVSVFRVASDGVLSNVANVTDNNNYELSGASSVGTAQIGGNTYLFVTGFIDNGVSVFEVDSSGELSNVANVDNNDNMELAGARSVSTAQVGNSTYLFVAGFTDDGVNVFEVESNGNLRSADIVDDGDNTNYELDGARSVSTAQIGNNTYLFVAGFEDDGVSVFRVANGGILTNVANVGDSDDTKLNGASSVSTAQIGGNTYLFAAGYSDDGVSVFRVDANDPNNLTLTNVANVDDSENSNYELDGAVSVNTTQIGNATYLFVAGEKDGGVSIFRVESSGDLINVANVDNGNYVNSELVGAVSVNTTQIGNATYLFLSSARDDEVSVFQMDGATNNTFLTALNIRKRQSYSGYISANGSNYYRIYLNIGDHIFETSGSLDTSCNIYSSNNINLSLASDDNSGTANNCQIIYNITKAGYYYLRISSSGSGNYTLLAVDGLPDLVVEFTVGKTVIASGDTVTLSATVTNKGILTSGLTTLRYYRSDDAIISRSDTQIAPDVAIRSLPADRSSNKTVRLASNSVSNGYYGACVIAVTGETNITNNCSAAVDIFKLINVANVAKIENSNYELMGASSVSTAQIGSNTYLFVAGFTDSGVSVFRVASDGALSNVVNVTDNDNNYELAGAVSVNTTQIGSNTYLFVAGRTDDGVSVFEVESSGDLRNVANVDNNINIELNGASSVSTAQIGNNTYLFVAGFADDGVSVFEVESSGDLRNVENVSDNNNYELGRASSVSTAQIGNNTYLFVAGFTDNGVSVFKVDSSGDLSNVANVDDSDDTNYELKGASSVSTAQIGSNTYLFVAGYEDNGVSVFRVANDGSLSNVVNVDSSGENDYELKGALSVSTAQIGSNTYLFVAGYFDDGVSIFRVESSGDLINVANVDDIEDGNYQLAGAASVTTTQIGNNSYLFVAGRTNSGVSVFQMDGLANNTFLAALNIRKGQSYSGNIANNVNNYYRIYLSIGNHTFETSGSLDTSCNIYSSNNTNSSLASDGNSGTANNCQITYNVNTAGYYYLRISASGSGDYTLMVP